MVTRKKTPATKPRRQPETLRLRNIAPSLTVNDVQASLAWYRDVVGFTVDETWEHGGKLVGASMAAGTAYLYLTQDDWAKGRDRVKGEGCRLTFYTAQDIDEIASRLKARGATLASEPQDQPWGARTFDLVDPDGYKLTISSLT